MEQLEHTPHGWTYREIFSLPMPAESGGGFRDGVLEIPINVSNAGLEIGNGPDALIPWAHVERLRREGSRRRSWLSAALLRLANWLR